MFCIISAQFLSSWSANLHVLLRSVRVWRTEVSQTWTGLTFTLCSIRTDLIAALTVAHGASWCHCAAFLTSHVWAVGQEFWKQTQEVDKKKLRMDVETRRRSSLKPELFPGNGTKTHKEIRVCVTVAGQQVVVIVCLKYLTEVSVPALDSSPFRHIHWLWSIWVIGI